MVRRVTQRAEMVHAIFGGYLLHKACRKYLLSECKTAHKGIKVERKVSK